MYKDQGHLDCKFCGQPFDQWAAPASAAAASESEHELRDMLAKLGISQGEAFAEQIRDTLVKRQEEAAAAAAASPQQSPQARVTEAAAKHSHALKRRGQAEQALEKLANEVDKLRDKLAEVLAKVGPAQEQLQEAVLLVEEADKYNEQCIASLREPKPCQAMPGTPQGRVQAAQTRLDAALAATTEARKSLKEEQDTEEKDKQEQQLLRAAEASKIKETEAAQASAAATQPVGVTAAQPQLPAASAAAPPAGAGGPLLQPQPQAAPAAAAAPPAGAGALLLQLRLQDAKADGTQSAAGADEIQQFDQDMPQQQLQLAAAKRTADAAASGIKEAEAASKKLRASSASSAGRAKSAQRG